MFPLAVSHCAKRVLAFVANPRNGSGRHSLMTPGCFHRQELLLGNGQQLAHGGVESLELSGRSRFCLHESMIRHACNGGSQMPEPQKVDSRENRILELLHYCEELAAHKVALCRVFEQQLKTPSWQDVYAQQLEETRQKLDPAFLTLHAYVRERDWIGLRSSLKSILDKLVDDED